MESWISTPARLCCSQCWLLQPAARILEPEVCGFTHDLPSPRMCPSVILVDFLKISVLNLALSCHLLQHAFRLWLSRPHCIIWINATTLLLTPMAAILVCKYHSAFSLYTSSSNGTLSIQRHNHFSLWLGFYFFILLLTPLSYQGILQNKDSFLLERNSGDFFSEY